MNEAESRGTLDAISTDLRVLERLLHESREFTLFLLSPVISSAKKSGVLKELLGGKVTEDTLSFVLLLTQKGREGLLREIVEQFAVIRDNRLGIIEVRVKAATELSQSQGTALQQRLEHYTQKKVRMHVALDHSLKGGLVIQIGDTVHDASIRHQLEMLKKQFLAGTLA